MPDEGVDRSAENGFFQRLRQIASGPLKLLPEAIQAVPAVKYALAGLAVAGCVAVAIGYFKDARLALIATIAGLGLMGVMLIFAKAAKLNARLLKGPAVVFVWFSLMLFVVWAGGMTLSAFAGWPVKISLFGSTPPPSHVSEDSPHEAFLIIVPDEEALAMMSEPSPFSILIGTRRIPLGKEGVVIGPARQIPEDIRAEYRQYIGMNEPTRARMELNANLIKSMQITYEGRPCKGPDISAMEQRLWVLHFDACN